MFRNWKISNFLIVQKIRKLLLAFSIFCVVECASSDFSKAIAWSSTQVYGLYGLSIYKSSLAQQNDTGYSNLLGVAHNIFTESHIFQIELEQEAIQVNF